jgi:hypothetical protein
MCVKARRSIARVRPGEVAYNEAWEADPTMRDEEVSFALAI